jgi:hypothetical protein
MSKNEFLDKYVYNDVNEEGWGVEKNIIKNTRDIRFTDNKYYGNSCLKNG